ncbi:MAG: ABC transporter permease [Planctomycetaceae bacterium]|jgi:ABC-type transport system involved in multi-copper enzyme maturation permease subunit|nr:ABC transporter permease [Planctomycetaceae bacterium]
MKPIRALFWKEYRQQILLPAAMAILCVLTQTCIYGIYYALGVGSSVEFPGMTKVAGTFLVIYAIAGSAILFAKEKEDQTDAFLRNMPVRGSTVLIGKLTWLIVSMAALAVALTFVTLVWLPILGARWATTADEWKDGMEILFIYLFTGVCHGLFWSTLTSKQLHAVVITLASAFGSLLFSAWTISCFFYCKDIDFTLVLYVYLFVSATLGGFGVWNGNNWLRKRQDKTIVARIGFFANKQRRRKEITIEQLKTQKPMRGEFLALVWQCYRQSSYLVWFVLLMAAAILLWSPLLYATERYNIYNTHLSRFLREGIPLFSWIFGFIVCSNIFYPDHRKKGILFLTYRGVSPGKVWRSRIVLFGSLMILCCAALNGTYFIDKYWGLSKLPLQRYSDIVIGMIFIFTMFAIGQFASMITRSVILPLITTGVGLFLAFWWMIYLHLIEIFSGNFEMEIMSSVLFSLPMLLSFFVASRMRIHDCMRERPLRASMRKIALCFAAPFVLTIAALAVYRIATVPTANYGYKLDDWALRQNVNTQENDNRATELFLLTNNGNHFDDYKTAWKNVREFWENPLNTPQNAYFGERMFYDKICVQAIYSEPTPEFLKDAIAFLETTPECRIPSETLTRRHYERIYHNVKSNWRSKKRYAAFQDFMIYDFPRWIAPWEKTRALAYVKYRFQTDSLIAEQSEQLIFQNRGSAEYLQKKIQDTQKETPNKYFPLDYSFRELPVTPCTLFLSEAQRRETLIVLALRLWMLEHDGALPETLDELRGTYLSEIPLTPFYNVPFDYVPHPAPETEAALSPKSPHEKGTPYLAYQYDSALPGYLQHYGNNETQRIIDLKPNREKSQK